VARRVPELLAGAWGTAHLQVQTISSTYNVVQFRDPSTGRIYYVLMEGIPGEIPAPANHPSGSVTITDIRGLLVDSADAGER
jgi:hypothetical protein